MPEKDLPIFTLLKERQGYSDKSQVGFDNECFHEAFQVILMKKKMFPGNTDKLYRIQS